jgi:hypothetical protein
MRAVSKCPANKTIRYGLTGRDFIFDRGKDFH